MRAETTPEGRCATAVEALHQAAERVPDVEAYVEAAGSVATASERRAITFGALDRAADGLAGFLADRGVGEGDVVCLVLPSSIDYAVCYAASARLGAVTSGVNPRLGPAERDAIVAKLRPTVTVVDPSLDTPRSLGMGTVLERAETAAAWDGPAPKRKVTLSFEHAVAIVWTSGTTGEPKGAVFCHRHLAAVSDGADVLSEAGDRRLSPLPFAHVGYMTKVWDEFAHSITSVITRTPWRADETLLAMALERVTVAQGVPTQWALMLADPAFDLTDLGALRIVGTGAAPMPAEQVRALRRRAGVPVVVRYASTESPICSGTVPGDADEIVATTVGRPVSGVEIRIVGDDGVPVPSGEPGRVEVRSGAVMRGYLGGADVAGWVAPGDVGVLDVEGYLHLVGRVGERYIRGGYNVYPSEVESILLSHPTVGKAAVVGTEDPVLGEVGVAFVVPEGDAVPDLTSMRAYCKSRLADYKSPDVLVVVDDLPLTSMMKVDKRALAGPARHAAHHRTDLKEPALPGKEGR